MSTPPPPVPSQQTESLVKRLAGPSTGKAGLAKDQTEINRIIAEASKDSKFYENEKKKDKELTERIARILRKREEAMKSIDIAKIEVLCDGIISDLESERDLSQTIVHVDMDAFFANVEVILNPKLKGKPFGVNYGVLSTASYEARKYGVRSGMAGFIAKKLCPEIIFVSSSYSNYSSMSNKVMSVCKRYDPTMQIAGCDEGYLNITEHCQTHQIGAAECVQEMRRIIFEETGLTASAGIAPNKMLAKICSDRNKPNGQFELPFDREALTAFMRDLSIRKIPGIGRVNERLLESIGIKTCGDIYTHRATLYVMDKEFGHNFLFNTYLGIGSNVVQPGSREERKSIGSERTFRSLSDKGQILQKLEEVATELEKDMKDNGWTGRTVTLKFKLDTFQVFSRAKSFNRWIYTKEELFQTGKELLEPEFPLTIRLIGLRVTKLKDLRAPPTTGGIKRFFESVSADSPRKRMRGNPETEDIDDDEPPRSSQLEESMPGYHEEDDNNDLMKHEGWEDEDDEIELIQSSTSKPDHRPALTNDPVQAGPSKPRSSRSKPIRPEASPPPQPSASLLSTQQCPICGKTMETDNQGLNAHIDFCLSRGAILEAQTGSNASIRPSSSNKHAVKPQSKGATKTRGGKG